MSFNRKLFACLLASSLLFVGCDNAPISSDLAYEYALKLEDYVAKTGDDLILIDHFLDDMDLTVVLERIDRELLLDYMKDYLTDAYSDGWNDCEEEIEERRDDWYWDGYYEGEIDGYAIGYAHGSGDVPYDEDMIRPPDNGYIP